MIRLFVNFLEFLINHFYQNRWYPRFYVLETVARVPYFAYISVLHLYESLGCWRKADWLKVHFAESWNELHHLLIMESLGGDRYWIDRFIAQHAALVYYWVIVILYLIRPKSAYYFAELVERHAYHTYDTFLKEHGDELKALEAPQIAVNYYRDGDLYMFDEFQTSRPPAERRPLINNLYDSPIEGDVQANMLAESGQKIIDAGGNPFTFIHHYAQLLEPMTERALVDSWNACQGTDAIIAHGTAFWGYDIAQKLGVPFYLAGLQPFFPNRDFPPRENLFKTASLARSAFQVFFGQLIGVIERHFWLQHLNLWLQT